jgi:hypothetical protein
MTTASGIFSGRKKVGWLKALIFTAALVAFAAPLTANAQQRERSGAFNDIVVQQGETADKIACFMCTVYVHGTVDGKIAVSLGNVVVDGTVDGKVAIFGGDLKVRSGGVVDGEVAIAGGKAVTDAGGTLGARVKSTSAAPIVAVIVGIFAVPILFLALVIWFIVWLVRRGQQPRFPYPPPPRY